MFISMFMLFACALPEMNEQEIVSGRVNAFFNDLENGRLEDAKEYLTGEAKEFVDNIDINKYISDYLGAFSFIGIPSKISEEATSKLLKEAFKSHEIIEINRISNDTFEVSAKVEMFDFDKLNESIKELDIGKILGDNYQEAISALLSGNKDAIIKIINDIIENIKEINLNKNKEELMSLTTLKLEVIKIENEWYINKIIR